MARPWRTEFPNACYHVMSRGNDRQDIFIERGDFEVFIELPAGSVPRFKEKLKRDGELKKCPDKI